MGKAAVAAVVRRISSPDLQPEVHLIEPRLVLRSTTSALNA
jgi:DNA-binding LacI/PurR family transcriptional regulator